MTSILLALSDKPTLTVISYYLERCGFVINAATTTEELLTSIDRIEPNILILDEDLLGSSKVENICANIKAKNRTKNINIILITKNSKDISHNHFNDFISKPFVPSELINKIRTYSSSSNNLNNNNSSNNTNKILSHDEIEMNVNSFRVSRFGKVIHLGPTEFKILQCFLELPGKVLSREHIMNHVWGYNSQVEPRTIDVHINRLRIALKNDNDESSIIRTIRSAGYSLNTSNSLVKA